jgi:ribosome-interacting GTPase 1
MPANVSFEFENAKLEYDQASSPEAKLAALVKMQRFAPSHKGGENLRKDISKKIALLKKDMEKKKKQEKRKGRGSSIAIKKEGIGQIAILGAPNSGKSTLLNRLTGIGAKVASYPFTTTKPIVGMMDYFGGKVQLVELPAIVEGSSKGKASGLELLSVARNADALLVVARSQGEKALVERELFEVGISLNKREKGKEAKKAIFLDAFEEAGLEELKEKVFAVLDKIIIYTKKPGGKIDRDKPLGLPLHSTVKDAARHLHKDFERKLRFARVWGSTRYPGQRVSKDYELKNRDTIEVSA